MAELASLLHLSHKTTHLHAPQNYFSGVGLRQVFVPDNIVAFHREHQDHTLSGFDGISERSGKYDQHHRYVLLIVLQGEGSIGVEQTIYSMMERHALLIFPHQLHYYIEVPEKFNWFYITFEAASPGNECISSLRNNPKVLNEGQLNKLGRFIDLYLTQSRDVNPLCLTLELQELIVAMRDEAKDCPVINNKAKVNPSAATEIVRRIKNYIYNHLNEDVSIFDIAEHIGFSESYVRSAFKRRIGISLGHFILAARLTHSAYLLNHTDRKVGDISKACGFDSQLSFSRAFKRNFSASPRDYRKQQQIK